MKIIVPRDHTHAGTFYRAGMLVDLPEEHIAWLLKAEGATRAQMLPVEPAPTPEPESAEPDSVVEAESE